jgi:predicted RNA-binding protein Jag
MAEIIDKQMSATEIIRKDLERGGFTKEEDKFLKALARLIQQDRAVVVRHNNTVFVGVRKEPGVLEVHMYTLDTPNMLLGAMKVGIDTARKAGVKKLVSETDNYKLIKMMQSMDLPVEVKKKGKSFAWSLELK